MNEHNKKDFLILELKKYKIDDIIITKHAEKQAIFRGIFIDEIKENIINPIRLSIAIEQEAEFENELKFDCYFAYSNTQCQRYVLVLNKKCVVCTVIKIKRRWQREAERKWKK
jgi:hypothetical protein